MSRMKFKLPAKLLITILIFIIIDQSICQRYDLSPDIQFYFSKYRGGNEFRQGDKTGFEMRVNFAGDYKLYTKHYMSERFLEKEGLINEYQRDSLLYHFEEIDFLSIPDHLPLTRYVRWPSKFCLIGFKITEKDSIKFVRTDLTADRKYYPPGFLNFISKIESILFKGIDFPR